MSGRQRQHLVAVHWRARREWPWLPRAAPAGSCWVGPDGRAVLILPDGDAFEP